MAKKKGQLFIHNGFQIKDDAQRAEAEAIARKGWHDDDDLVVDPVFATALRAEIEELRKRADVPPELLYKIVIRARIAHARDDFSKKRPMIERALVAARDRDRDFVTAGDCGAIAQARCVPVWVPVA